MKGDCLDTTSTFREVSIGLASPKKKFSNKVTTAHYNLFTWIPKSLIEQFYRATNIYFLFTCILATFPFSPSDPFGWIGSFACVLIFTMIKEGIEDISRNRQDSEVNKALIWKYSNGEKNFIMIQSQHASVGDIIKVHDNENIPADLVLISSSSDKRNAFVDTMNLDGETNLKEKNAAHHTDLIRDEKDLDGFKAELFVDLPNNSLVKWNCNIKVNQKLEPLSIKQLLLRGCKLKNTDWVFGVVVYAGEETKIVLNSKKPYTKHSSLQRKINLSTMMVIGFIFVISFIFALLGKQWKNEHPEAKIYIADWPESGATPVILSFFTFWLQFSGFIPINLYVEVEILRLILSSFIKNDLKMYNHLTDQPAKVSSSDIIEELGQVEFIFTDKTGTLTKNEMTLIKSGINYSKYLISEILPNPPNFFYIDRYLKLLAICNSAYPIINNGEITYQAMSPDEIALLEASKSLEYVLEDRRNNKVSIRVKGDLEDWEVLAELPFSADRKRMSVMVRRNEEIFLLAKGADSVMLPLLAGAKIDEIQEELLEFAEEGLRTLVMAGKLVGPEEYGEWIAEWNTVLLSNAPDKEKKIEEICEVIEKNLEFYGTSAIEDKLQDGVAESLATLTQAGIRIWMLTGDKEETSIEIAKSCNLLHPQTELITFFTADLLETTEKLNFLQAKYNLTPNDLQKSNKLPINSLAISINGIGLSIIKSDPDLSKKFFALGLISSTCICCRLSPSQKQDIVKLCRKLGNWMTLAIGDGANDVSMIQEAHIGIGISGKDGTQAVLAAEFAFDQFSCLSRLLLTHGSYAYKRVSFYVQFYFYKDFAYSAPEVWFSIFSGFSGQLYVLLWITRCYDLFWTSLPCVTFFSLDQDVGPEVLMMYPGLYTAGQKNIYFNLKSFGLWIFFAIYSASWAFWLPMAGLDIDQYGHELTLFWRSTVTFIIILHVVYLKLFIVTQFWTKFSL